MRQSGFGVILGMMVVAGCVRISEPLTGPVNVAAFASRSGLIEKLTDGREETFVDVAGGQAIELEWTEPRDIRAVTIKGPGLGLAGEFEVQYWYRIWPDNGTGGWQKLDDPFNGRFVTGKTTASEAGGGIRFAFEGLDRLENAAIKEVGQRYRRTYKIRVVCKVAARITEVEAYTEAEWKTAVVRVEMGARAKRRGLWEGTVSGRNARILWVDPWPPTRRVMTVGVNYAGGVDRLSADRGALVFNAEGFSGFSVFVDDVVREGGMYIRDIDAFVSDASLGLSYGSWGGPKDCWDGTVMEKVAGMAEQSYEGLAKAYPAKRGREAHLGVAQMRQEFTITPEGDIVLLGESLRSAGADLARRPWREKEIRYEITTGSKAGAKREARRYLEGGYLPVIHTEWESELVAYHQAAFATVLHGGIGENEGERRGDEPVVLLDRIEMRNRSGVARRANVWLGIGGGGRLKIGADGLLVLEAASDGKRHEGLTPVRGWIDRNGKGELEHTEGEGGKRWVRYWVDLEAGEAHRVYLNVPYIELLTERDLEALKGLGFDREHDGVVRWWEERLVRGMRYEVPEGMLNDLFKANLWHVLISTDREPETGLYQHGAATMHYRNFANETCMVARSLELRGEHAEAERLLEPFVVSQGRKGLPGRFTDKEGVFYSAMPTEEADAYTAQGYNMHHGFVLRAVAEHCRWTRDEKYVERVLPKLIAGCDWIKRQRETTKVMRADGSRPLEYGLAPAGDLEDVEEYLYWYATNGYYYAGLSAADQVLGEWGNPEAMRIGHEAELYREDILRSLSAATAASPVVRLRDGTWAPYVPSRAYAYTHLKEGWIREALYGSLHLLEAGVVESNHPVVKWSLLDLEDNIFLSKESGYGIGDVGRDFYHFGGVTLQPNLLPNAMAHLRRDEIANFVRVFYNALYASVFGDVVCFAEWVRRPGSGDGPLYKTPDECKFIELMRNMLILEQGRNLRTLRLGAGVPRAWMADGKRIVVEGAATLYGPMEMRIESHVGQGRIEARMKLPQREPADVVLLRLRHPEGKEFERVTVNGEGWDKVNRALELVILPGNVERVEVVAWY